jgi:hypothetical protein
MSSSAVGLIPIDCPHCRRRLDLAADSSRFLAAAEQGEHVPATMRTRSCPTCKAGLFVTVGSEGIDVTLSHEPRHPRWSARGLEWGGGNAFAVASIECLGVTIVRREGMNVTMGAELARCEHYGFDPSGERLLVDSTPFPRRDGSARSLGVWTPRTGAVVPLATSEIDLEPPMLARARSSRDAIGWHRGGEHVAAVTSKLGSPASLTVWSIRDRAVRTERIGNTERGRAWLEPGGDRLLWEEQLGGRSRLAMFRIDPSTRGAVPILVGELLPTAPMDICDVVWEQDGSVLLAYVQLERGLSLYDRMPYGLVRLGPKLRVGEQLFPLAPELCPMKPAPCSLFRAAGATGRDVVVFVTDAAYTLDARDFRAKGVLPTNMVGAEALRFDPTGEVVAIAGPSDIHIASLSSEARTSVRSKLG